MGLQPYGAGEGGQQQQQQQQGEQQQVCLGTEEGVGGVEPEPPQQGGGGSGGVSKRRKHRIVVKRFRLCVTAGPQLPVLRPSMRVGRRYRFLRYADVIARWAAKRDQSSA
eukprot:TRINITY_DN1994_c3_g1_i1.p2 TRINITY_DN1994_c3_g1~~TRINITY_DN1994_c3_g1_i1.p2  ORF type:complete len:123 (+),score=41.94 TRINITY_DN1994_c3_g1_i1:41-370(+)